jgi:hypothetical protein
VTRKKLADAVGLSDVFVRPPHVLWREGKADEVVLLDMNHSNRYYELDHWVARLWRKLGGERSVSELIAELKQESKFPDEIVRREVVTALGSLREMKLVVRKAEPG